ncbi:penicillin-binding protein 1C [Aquisalimonas lutea]|uniref:penicillin-binding protein 1C n=1 Tax=Aquisalimonas lutea TaxID=1327750 RepID=UPI0025B2BA73|nr:penicillin-binding protein 1C [Aquisalimonas lutea]MDN3517572.1 penicillin-binding protein 1C [Aquisalimonas lutea]
MDRGKRRRLGRRAVLPAVLLSALAVAWAAWPRLPEPLFGTDYSAVLLDRNQELLSARVAPDGQWRFPPREEVPERFATALIAFEDERFRHHPGVDPVAVARASWENLAAGRIVSGASTLSMQVVRLALDDPPRTLPQKVYETLLALRLETRYSKDAILSLYAAHAPFGGNVVGLRAAAWRYFGRSPAYLSWAEAATLAVLPNAPGLIHPGRGRERLRAKRDALLRKLHGAGELTAQDLELALLEPVPDGPRALPRHAGHLLDRLRVGSERARFTSTLDADVQARVEGIVQEHGARLRRSGIHNAAALVVDNRTFEVVAYAGNTRRVGHAGHGYAMDLVQRPRSSGSILKPFLFANMVEHGMLQPGMLVPDVPAHFSSFSPENYDQRFRGAVRARAALADSLNVPAVFMLRRHGIARFHDLLEQLGMTTLHRSPQDYGLTLVLGGAEATLWDLTGMYANLAGTLASGGRAGAYRLRNPRVLAGTAREPGPPSPLGAGSAWVTLNTLLEVDRPGVDRHWRDHTGGRRIAWKTGTSYGLRDGWAVGTTPRYTVGVWAGNAAGEGRSELTGTTTAGPLLFAIFDQLETGGWFDKPRSRLKTIRVCRADGHLPNNGCPTRRAEVPVDSHYHRVSRNHRWIHLDESGQWRVNADCESVTAMRNESWFVLPPVQAHYYRRRNADYRVLPPVRPDCRESAPTQSFAILYPDPGARVYIPTDFGGRRSRLVLKAIHRVDDATLYWHLDGRFVGETEVFHEVPVDLTPGAHTLTVVDETGARRVRRFRVAAPDADRRLPTN